MKPVIQLLVQDGLCRGHIGEALDIWCTFVLAECLTVTTLKPFRCAKECEDGFEF